MGINDRWYQKFHCRNCDERFTQFPALLGCARAQGVDLFRVPHYPERNFAPHRETSEEIKETREMIRTHVVHPCSETESGIADLVGFTTEAPQVKEGGIRQLTDDEVSERYRT